MKENIATYSRFYYIAGYCDRFFSFRNSKMRYEKCETRDFSMWLHWCIALSSVEICAELNWAFGRDRKIQCSHTNGFIIYNFSLLFCVIFWISFFCCCFKSVYFLSAFFRAMYPNDIRFEHHSFEWQKRLLTASRIAHISTLFNQIPWLKH